MHLNSYLRLIHLRFITAETDTKVSLFHFLVIQNFTLFPSYYQFPMLPSCRHSFLLHPLVLSIPFPFLVAPIFLLFSPHSFNLFVSPSQLSFPAGNFLFLFSAFLWILSIVLYFNLRSCPFIQLHFFLCRLLNVSVCLSVPLSISLPACLPTSLSLMSSLISDFFSPYLFLTPSAQLS